MENNQKQREFKIFPLEYFKTFQNAEFLWRKIRGIWMLDNNQNFDAVSRTLASYEQRMEAQFELRAQRDRMLDGTSARWQLMYSGGCLGVF